MAKMQLQAHGIFAPSERWLRREAMDGEGSGRCIAGTFGFLAVVVRYWCPACGGLSWLHLVGDGLVGWDIICTQCAQLSEFNV